MDPLAMNFFAYSTTKGVRRTFVLIGLLILAGSTPRSPSAAGQQPTEKTKYVHLVVDYGDGVEKHFTQLVWKEGQTAFDMLRAAEKHARGVKVNSRGRGDTAFVQQIDDLPNGVDDKFWTFSRQWRIVRRRRRSRRTFRRRPSDLEIRRIRALSRSKRFLRQAFPLSRTAHFKNCSQRRVPCVVDGRRVCKLAEQSPFRAFRRQLFCSALA